MPKSADQAERSQPAPSLKTVRVPEKFAPLFEQAQSYVTRYFSDLSSTPERGTLEIQGQRYVLVRAASMSVEFYEMVKSFYREEEEARAVVHALLFDIAHAMGLADAKTFAERMKLTDPIARLKTVKRAYSQAYWINGTRGRGTIAIRVGPTEYGLATSDPVRDLPRRTQILEAEGGDPWRTLERLGEEGWEAKT